MRIRERNFGMGAAEISLDAAVVRALDGSGYDVGQMEALKSSQQKIAEMFTRLIRVLTSKLSASDIEEILGYSFEVFE